MEAQELRQFNSEELKTRIKQWREELFRSRFKAQSSEAKDTSVLVKLRRDIARGLTILNEKARGAEPVAAKATAEAAPVDQPATAKPAKAKKASTGAAKTKKATSRKKESKE